jgi:NifU-like protein involved in Fe-S cluster formation
VSTDPYSAKVRELFSAVPHAGETAGGGTALADGQGVRLRLSATATDGRVKAMRFKAWGCPHVIAATEAACAALEGQPVAALANWAAADVMQNLPVPVEKTGRILVLEDTVRSLGRSICGGSVTQKS